MKRMREGKRGEPSCWQGVRQTEFLAPLIAEAVQATAKVEARVLCLEDSQVQDRGQTILALRSLGTRIQELESQPFPAHADVGGPLTHEISQMGETWERHGQSLEDRMGRLTLD